MRESLRKGGGPGLAGGVRPLWKEDELAYGSWAFREIKQEGVLQSCTRRETLGLATMLMVLREAGFVVMTMTGCEEYGEDGR